MVRGRKVGLTSRPMQQLLGVDEPDFGVLLDDMFIEDGDEIALETMLQPRVEAEMAFVMARDLAGPGVTVADALTAIAGVLPGDRGRGQPDRGLAHQARRHGRGQRVVRPAGPRRHRSLRSRRWTCG